MMFKGIRHLWLSLETYFIKNHLSLVSHLQVLFLNNTKLWYINLLQFVKVDKAVKNLEAKKWLL